LLGPLGTVVALTTRCGYLADSAAADLSLPPSTVRISTTGHLPA